MADRVKYLVFLDGRGYVTNITPSNKGFVELNLGDYDFLNGRKRAYRLGRNELIFDEHEYERIQKAEQKQKDEAEIADLEKKLNETDYIMARWAEDIMALDNRLTWIVDAIAISIKYSKQYKETILNRKEWRKRIEEIRND